eukprot:1159857-Pelagomonas_calceolata.AAC.3
MAWALPGSWTVKQLHFSLFKREVGLQLDSQPEHHPMPPSLRSYLQQVLSHTSGPNSVPYSEITKAAIEEQLINLQEIFPSLGISVDEFCTNDGRVLHLLKADGTIPVHYQVCIVQTGGYLMSEPYVLMHLMRMKFISMYVKVH